MLILIFNLLVIGANFAHFKTPYVDINPHLRLVYYHTKVDFKTPYVDINLTIQMAGYRKEVNFKTPYVDINLFL